MEGCERCAPFIYCPKLCFVFDQKTQIILSISTVEIRVDNLRTMKTKTKATKSTYKIHSKCEVLE